MKKIGVLALQGAVAEPIMQLQRLNIQATKVKHPDELLGLDGLIIPGGESTVMSRLIEKNALYEPIRQFAEQEGAVFGMCAGLILCSNSLTQSHQSNQRIRPLNLIDIVTERNGFGRQKESFEMPVTVMGFDTKIPAVFIRAPYIVTAHHSVDILATVDERIVLARQNRCLVSAFHPELTSDLRMMRLFLTLVR